MRNLILSAAFGVSTLIAGAAQATSITIQTFNLGDFNTMTAGGMVEDFESYTSAKWDRATVTSVGTFDTLGGTGSGKVCKDNNGGVVPCTNLAVQINPNSGQGNLVPLKGIKALSSNDTKGIAWTAFLPSGRLFDSAIFALRDVADISGTVFKVTVDGVTSTLTGLKNDNKQLVKIDFGGNVGRAFITMESKVNDGFTMDGATLMPSPVPLPASALLLLGGMAGLGAMARRRKAATA